MTASNRKSWIAKLPTKLGDSVTHRYRIAGKATMVASNVLAEAERPSVTTPALASDRMRAQMVSRIEQRGVSDQRVLSAMLSVPRHPFVDAALASRAYEDSALPIGHGQTISQPYIVARMLELLRNGRELGHVLEVGTGCGYQAAVLGRLARLVVSIERIKALHELARDNLRPMRLPNVRLHFGDGREGLLTHAPYDAIVLAAAGEEAPKPLLAQLAIGGRLVAPVARPGGGQQLIVVDRLSEDRWESRQFDDVHFVPLRFGTT